MGMYVSQLRSVPVRGYDYYAYLVDASASSVHSKAVDRFFDGFAKQSGVEAVIVRGPQDLSYELFRFLQSHAQADFERLEAVFHEVTCLIISEGPLQTTSKPIHVLPLLPRIGEDAAYEELLDALLGSLLGAMHNHKLTEFVRSLGAQKLVLSEIKDGMFVATLRRLNEALELKPNIVGLGVNLNAIMQRLLEPSERR